MTAYKTRATIERLTVNHNLNIVDPDTGAHTQGIANTWWGVKRSYPRTGTSKELLERYVGGGYLRKCFRENKTRTNTAKKVGFYFILFSVLNSEVS